MTTETKHSKSYDTFMSVLNILKESFGFSTTLMALLATGQKVAELYLVNAGTIDEVSFEIIRDQMIIELQLAGMTGAGYVVIDRLIQLCKKLSDNKTNTPTIPPETILDR